MKFCLIGSSRFKDLYVEANKALTLRGHIVYSIATVSSSAGQELPKEQKEVLDLVHLRKIMESEAVVLVTDESGYYGDSSRREMLWAGILNKELLIFVPADPEPLCYSYGPMFGQRKVTELPTQEELQEMWRKAKADPNERPTTIIPGEEG